MNRRHVLIGTVSLFSASSGCSALSSESSMLDLVIENQTNNYYEIEFDIYQDSPTKNEARVYSNRIEVDSNEEKQEENVAEAEQLIISFSVYDGGGRLTDQNHIHFFPGDDENDNVQVFDIRSGGNMAQRVLT